MKKKGIQALRLTAALALALAAVWLALRMEPSTPPQPEVQAASRTLVTDGELLYDGEALAGADALLVVTEWKAFRSPNFETMKTLLKNPVIFDGRNLYDPATMREQGFEYFPIGRRA